MISFYYDHYEADGKRHHGYTVSGEDRIYRVSPYQITASDDRYFLLCNEEGSEDISVFKVDMMTDVTVLEEPARLQKSLKGLETGEKNRRFPLFRARYLYWPSGALQL